MCTCKETDPTAGKNNNVEKPSHETSNAHRSTAPPNPFSFIFFCWMNKIFQAGSKRTLGDDDLLPLRNNDKSRLLLETLDEEWTDELRNAERRNRKPRFWRALLGMFSSRYLALVLSLKLLASAATLSLALLMWFFLKSLAQGSLMDKQTAALFIAGLAVMSLVKVFAAHHADYQSLLQGMRIRVATTGIIFKKLLILSRAGMANISSGSTINLASNDSQRLERAVLTTVLGPVALFEVTVAVVLLWVLVGWQALAGILFYIAVVVYTLTMTKRFAHLHSKAVTLADERLGIMGEVISGIRAVKMYALEWYFRDNIQKLRGQEMKYIRLKSLILSSFSALYFTCTAIATLISITSLMYSEIHLSVFKVFTLVMTLNVVRFSVTVCLVECLRGLADAKVAAERVERFLLTAHKEPTGNQTPLVRNNTLTRRITPRRLSSLSRKLSKTFMEKRSAYVVMDKQRFDDPKLLSITSENWPRYNKPITTRIKLDCISADWSTDITDNDMDILQDITLKADGNKLLVVTGPVGSGKSSLLMSILGEIPLKAGTISVRGRISYVPQIPWVFSGTIRDNITFGTPMEKERFDRVLEACDLVKDLQSFPKGDLSVIGQRGASLSGGQQARVCLARAVYADADVYLLDDPLSALDAKVGQTIFNKCINGELGGKLKVLVTHQLQYLKHADYIVVLQDGLVECEGEYLEVVSRDLMKELLEEHQNEEEPHATRKVSLAAYRRRASTIKDVNHDENVSRYVDMKELMYESLLEKENASKEAEEMEEEEEDTIEEEHKIEEEEEKHKIEDEEHKIEEEEDKIEEEEHKIEEEEEHKIEEEEEDKIKEEEEEHKIEEEDHQIEEGKEEEHKIEEEEEEHKIEKEEDKIEEEEEGLTGEREGYRENEDVYNRGRGEKDVGKKVERQSEEQIDEDEIEKNTRTRGSQEQHLSQKKGQEDVTVGRNQGEVEGRDQQGSQNSPPKKEFSRRSRKIGISNMLQIPTFQIDISDDEGDVMNGSIEEKYHQRKKSAIELYGIDGSRTKALADFIERNRHISDEPGGFADNENKRTRKRSQALYEMRKLQRKTSAMLEHPQTLNEYSGKERRRRISALSLYNEKALQSNTHDVALPNIVKEGRERRKSRKMSSTKEARHSVSMTEHPLDITDGIYSHFNHSESVALQQNVGRKVSLLSNSSSCESRSQRRISAQHANHKLSNLLEVGDLNERSGGISEPSAQQRKFSMPPQRLRAPSLLDFEDIEHVHRTRSRTLLDIHFEGERFRENDMIDLTQRERSATIRSELQLGRGTRSGSTFLELDEEPVLNLEEEDEDKMSGSITWRLYWSYFRAGLSAVLVMSIMVFFLIVQVGLLAPNWWLSRMSNMSRQEQKSSLTLVIYGAIVGGALILSTARAFLFFYAVLKSSEKLHDRMTLAVIKSPSLFFDTNPAGRIMNRFTRDISCMDDLLPNHIYRAFTLCLYSLGSILLPAGANPWLLLAIVPLIAVFIYFGRYYVCTSRELKRMEASRCSPVFSHIAETIDGIEMIRAARAQNTFLEKFIKSQDLNTEAAFLIHSSGRWMALRLDLLTVVFITAVAIGALLVSQDAALAGMSLTFAMEALDATQYGVRQCAEVENDMTSVERVMSYTQLPSEPGYGRQTVPREGWPEKGAISLKGMSLAYVEGAPNVLKDITIDIEARQKVGIVGRTGAGKSSIVAALFRMPDPKGLVSIDDIDLGTLDILSARTVLAVITQNPLLFGGSLRKNLDPFQRYSDQEIWTALEEVQLKRGVERLSGRLFHHVGEGGSNFSVGERQLLCLARALLQKTKVLVLDEATANVDFKTDRLIQQVIRTKFTHCTVLTVAHRLNTVMDYDKVLVLDHGHVTEYDSPRVLAGKPNGMFARMLKSHEDK